MPLSTTRVSGTMSGLVSCPGQDLKTLATDISCRVYVGGFLSNSIDCTYCEFADLFCHQFCSSAIASHPDGINSILRA